MIDVEQTEDMDVDEVRLEDEVGVSSSTVYDSPLLAMIHFLNRYQALCRVSLAGIHIGEDQQVVPYDWDTPCPDDGGLFNEGPWTPRVYDYGNRLDEAYAQASLNFPLGGDWVHNTEGVPCEPDIVIGEPVPVVDRKGRWSMFASRTFQWTLLCTMSFRVSLKLTDHLRDLHIGGNTDVNLISECPSTATQPLSALLNRDGPSASDAALVCTTNVFSSNSFQLEYLSAFDKEPFYYRLLHRNAPGTDISDPSWMENRLNELRLRLMQRKKEPDPTSTPRTPRTPVKTLDEMNEEIFARTHTPATEEALSPLIGCDLSNQDPFAILGDTPSTPTHVPELRFKDLCIADTPRAFV